MSLSVKCSLTFLNFYYNICLASPVADIFTLHIFIRIILHSNASKSHNRDKMEGFQ